MADTARTIAALLTLFADNTTGAISEQDTRDLIVSMPPSLGGMYAEANATATTLAVLNTWYKVLGTTTVYPDLVDFTMPASNRLTFGGATTRHIRLVGALAIESVSANQEGEISVYKNGVIVPGSTQGFKCLVIGNPTTVPLVTQLNMAPTDYIELYIRNITGANNMTVTYMNLSAEGGVHV